MDMKRGLGRIRGELVDILFLKHILNELSTTTRAKLGQVAVYDFGNLRFTNCLEFTIWLWFVVILVTSLKTSWW